MNTEPKNLLIEAARIWMSTEPGDKAADLEFKKALTQAGILKNPEDLPINIYTSGEAEYTVYVDTLDVSVSIDTQTGAISIVRYQG